MLARLGSCDPYGKSLQYTLFDFNKVGGYVTLFSQMQATSNTLSAFLVLNKLWSCNLFCFDFTVDVFILVSTIWLIFWLMKKGDSQFSLRRTPSGLAPTVRLIER